MIRLLRGLIFLAFQNTVGRETAVQKLMSSIFDVFIFDLLTSNSHRDLDDLEILEYPNGITELAPIHSCEHIFPAQKLLGITIHEVDISF